MKILDAARQVGGDSEALQPSPASWPVARIALVKISHGDVKACAGVVTVCVPLGYTIDRRSKGGPGAGA